MVGGIGYEPIICRNSLRSITTVRHYSYSAPAEAKPGTPMQGLDVFQDKDIPVVLERDQYPEWVFKLPTPLLTFAQLRRLPNENATLPDIHRFLRLKRRLKIKANNEMTKKK
jgi:Mitochondrial ribosomal protein L37